MSPVFYTILAAGLFLILVFVLASQIRHHRRKKQLSRTITSGEHAAALRNLLHLVKKDPDDLVLQLQLGRLQLKNGLAAPGLKTAQGLLARNLQGSGVTQIDALLLAADAENAAGHPEVALKHVLTAKGLDGSNQEVNLRLAGCQLRMGNFQEAFNNAGTVLRLDPANREALRLRGRAALQLDALEPAKEAFTRILSADGADFEAADALCRIYTRFGNAPEAASYGELARRLAATPEERARIGSTQAAAWLSVRDHAKARTLLDAALKEAKSRELATEILLLQIRTAEESGELDYLLQACRGYLRTNPHDNAVREKERRTGELLSNRGLQQYEMLPASQFSEFCPALAKAISGADQIQQSTINRDGSVDILASLTTRKKHSTFQFRFVRGSSPLGEMLVRDLYEKMRGNGAEAAWVVTNSDFTPGARTFSETRVVTLVNREKLVPYLGKAVKR